MSALVYTRKCDIKIILDRAIAQYKSNGFNAFIADFYTHILHHKVKFPLLEFCAKSIHDTLLSKEIIPFCDALCKRKTEGGNVIIGVLLQIRALNDFDQAMEKATTYIADADRWYVCDIIGERVFGYHLLVNFKATFKVFEDLSKHPSIWVVRSLGAGGHYAIKKGLCAAQVDTLFKLLITMSNTKEKEIRQGVGWAAKTTAKFHPQIIAKYQKEINERDKVPNWFRSKIAIGLNRNAYAKGKRSKVNFK